MRIKKSATQSGAVEAEADAGIQDPSRPTLWASLIFALATLLLAYPGLTGQTLFNPRSDQYTLGYAFRHFAEVSLREGNGIPQWNPYLQGGLPYVGAMHGDIFYPTALLRVLIGTAEGLTWAFPVHLFLAGLFTYLFLRAWRFPFYAAVIGGLAYMLSGSIAGYASPGHDGKLFVSALLPLSLHLLTRGIRDGRLWSWGAFAMVIGLALLSPHPQLLQYLLLVAGCFALYLAFSSHDEAGRLPVRAAISRLALAAGGIVLGLFISAIQYLPVMKYTPWSPRSKGHDYETATSFSFPIEETLNAYLPQFSGILDNYWGRNNIHFHSDYFGVVVLLLMGAAFGMSARRSFKRFWVATGVVALLWAYGGYTPLYHIIIHVPFTKYLRAPSTIIFVTAFAVAVLAAIGSERILRKQVSRRYAAAWGIAAGLFALFMSIGGYRVLADAVVGSIGMGFDPAVRDQALQHFSGRAEANTTNAIIGAWRSFAFVALSSGIIFAYLARRLSSKLAALGLAVFLAVDLWSVERLYWTYMPPASQTFATDAAIEAIKADIAKTGEPGRALLLPVGNGVAPLDPYFRKRALMNHFVRTVEGEQGNELGIYRRMMELDSGRVSLSQGFWRHENVRYLYTDADEATLSRAAAQLNVPPFVKLVGPVSNAAGSMISAYRVGMANPFAWVAGGAVKVEPGQVLPTVLDPRFQSQLAALVDTGSSLPVKDVSQLTSSTISARTASYAPGRVSIQLSAPANGGEVLVVSENFYPGWTATSGTSLLPISRVNYNLIGVALAPGTQRVELAFADPAYSRGKVVTLIALLVAVLTLVLGLIVDRRRRISAARPLTLPLRLFDTQKPQR